MTTNVQAAALAWLSAAEKLISDFATEHAMLLATSDRQLSASFEIGCFHALLRSYKKEGYEIHPENLQNGAYRYLTSPSGNPANFSYVRLVGPDGEFEMRQQVRVESHIAEDIRFTPDILIVTKGAAIDGASVDGFASGKRKLFSVKSDKVVAAHECKSLNPFPELMVGFLGMLMTAHSWYPNGSQAIPSPKGHLAPTLFVGGSARALHLKMIGAMQTSFRLNVVVGMHAGTWSLDAAKNRLTWNASVTLQDLTPLAA